MNMFFGYNVLTISRRLGRGQLDHTLVQPQPIWLSLLTEGFMPFSGSPVLLARQSGCWSGSTSQLRWRSRRLAGAARRSTCRPRRRSCWRSRSCGAAWRSGRRARPRRSAARRSIPAVPAQGVSARRAGAAAAGRAADRSAGWVRGLVPVPRAAGTRYSGLGRLGDATSRAGCLRAGDLDLSERNATTMDALVHNATAASDIVVELRGVCKTFARSSAPSGCATPCAPCCARRSARCARCAT